MITQLQIVQYNASGMVTSSYNVDLYEDIPLTVTKTVADIKEPQKRLSDYTKTITIPGTANNNQIFSMCFDLNRSIINSSTLNFTPDFNPNLKAEAIIYRKGIVQMRGYLQLTDIRIQDDGIQY